MLQRISRHMNLIGSDLSRHGEKLVNFTDSWIMNRKEDYEKSCPLFATYQSIQ